MIRSIIVRRILYRGVIDNRWMTLRLIDESMVENNIGKNERDVFRQVVMEEEKKEEDISRFNNYNFNNSCSNTVTRDVSSLLLIMIR